MKKNLMRSMFVLLTAIISFQFISCSDDDDPPNASTGRKSDSGSTLLH